MNILNQGTVYDSKEEAILEIFKKLDKDICQKCDKRIFLECKTITNQLTAADKAVA